MWGKWVYREVVKPERLVFIVSFSDEAGGTVRHPLAPDWPLQTLSRITFVAHDAKTGLTVQWSPFTPAETERNAFEAGRDSMRQGWSGTFDRLADYLATL